MSDWCRKVIHRTMNDDVGCRSRQGYCVTLHGEHSNWAFVGRIWLYPLFRIMQVQPVIVHHSFWCHQVPFIASFCFRKEGYRFVDWGCGTKPCHYWPETLVQIKKSEQEHLDRDTDIYCTASLVSFTTHYPADVVEYLSIFPVLWQLPPSSGTQTPFLPV